VSSDASPRPVETTTLDRDNPFLGLEPFREVDAAWFHGRDQDADSLVQLLRRTGPAVVYGASGLGKTSLLRAGLFPRLREQGMLPIYVRLVYQARLSDPLAQIRARIAAEIEASAVDAAPPPSATTLWEYFHRTPFWDERNRLLTPVLVFDQFEEIFTVGRAVDGRETLISELTDLIENHIPASVRLRVEAGETELPTSYERSKVKVVLSLREDFLPDLASMQAAIPSLRQNHYRLRPMSGTAAVQAVLGPGEHIVNDAVAADIVRFVASAGVHASGEDNAQSDLGALKVEPSLLSLVCRELNERRIRVGAKRITAELLAGSRETILRDFYQRATRDLGPLARAFIEDKLLTARGFRTTVALQNALDEPGITEAVIGALVDRRLVRREERLGIPHVELVHDVMTRFVAESRDRRRAEAGELEEQAARWRRFKGYATIALGLLFGLLCVAGYTAVRNAGQAEKAAKELVEQKDLERDRTEAATRKSLSRLVETLSRLAGADLARGERAAAVGRLALARSASGTLAIESAVRTWIEARTFSALQALVAQRASLGSRVSRLAVSPDGSRVLLIGADGAARVATPTQSGLQDGPTFFAPAPEEEGAGDAPQAQRMPVREQERAPRSQARLVHGGWSGDGETVILLDDTGRIARWRVSDGAGGVLGSVVPDVEQVVVDRSGGTVVVRGSNGGRGIVTVVRESSAGGDAQVVTTSKIMGDMAALAMDADGRRVAIASRARRAVVILDVGERLAEREVRLGAEPSAIAISGDGAQIVVGDMLGGLALVAAEDGRATPLALRFDSPILGLTADRAVTRLLVRPQAGPVVLVGRAEASAAIWQVIARYSGHRGKVRHAGMGGAAGELVVSSSSADGTVRVWEAGTGRLSDLHAHEGTDVMAWLMRGGRSLLSLSGDGSLRLWNRDAQAVGSEGRALSLGAPQLDAIPDGAKVGVQARAGAVAPAFSPDGRFFATLGSDGTVVRWRREAAGWAWDDCASGPSGGTGLRFSEDGRKLRFTALAGADCEWGPGAGARQAARGGERSCDGKVSCGTVSARAEQAVAASEPGRSVAVGEGGRRLVERREGGLAILAADGALERALLGHEGAIVSLAVTRDGKRGLSGAADGSVRLWDLERGRTLARWGGVTRGEASAAFSSDEREIAQILPGGEVWVVAAPALEAAVAGGRVCKLGHTARVQGIAFSQSGARLATAGADGCVMQHALQRDDDLPELSVGEPVRGVRYLGQEGLLTDSRTPRIYNANSGQLRASLEVPDGGDTRFVRVSAHDERILAVDARGGVVQWQMARPGTGRDGASVESRWRLPVAGRAGLVTAIGASVAGGRYALGDEAGGVRVAGLGDGALDLALPMPEGPVRALDFDDEGGRLLVVTETGARLYSLASPGEPMTLPGARGVAAELAPNGDSVILARDDGGVEIWTVDGAPQRAYEALLGVEEVSFAAAAAGRALGWSAHSTEIYVFSPGVGGGVEVTRLDLAQGALAAALAADGLGVAISSVQTLTLSTGDLRQPAATHALGGERFAHALSFVGNTTLVAGLGAEGVATFALPGWEPVAGPALDESWVLRADGAGGRVASLGGEVAAVWTPGSSAPVREFSHDGGLPIDIAFGPGPDRVVTLTEAGAARVWRLDAPAAPESTHFPVALVDAAWTPMGPRVVTLSQDARFQVWAASSAARPVIDHGMGGGFRVSVAAVSPTDVAIALGSTTGEVAHAMLVGETAPVFATDAVGGRASHGRPVTAIALSSLRIASASAEGDLRIWSTDGKVVAQHALQGEEVSALAFGADGQMLFASLDSGLVRVYDADVGEPLFVVDTGLDAAGPVALDPSASRLATASGEGRVRLWPMALPRSAVDGLLNILAPPR
jgi:WD40 repeat protein